MTLTVISAAAFLLGVITLACVVSYASARIKRRGRA
jgi:hypothetical protein